MPHNTQKNELQKKFANAKSKQINFYLLFMSLRAFKWSKFFHIIKIISLFGMGTNNHFTSLDLIELETDAFFFLYIKQICLNREKNSTAWLKRKYILWSTKRQSNISNTKTFLLYFRYNSLASIAIQSDIFETFFFSHS